MWCGDVDRNCVEVDVIRCWLWAVCDLWRGSMGCEGVCLVGGVGCGGVFRKGIVGMR